MAEETGNSLETLLDEDLLAQLKAKQGDNSWTVEEMLEVERRGYDFLSGDPDFEASLKKINTDFVKNVETAIAPAVLRISDAGSAWISASESLRGLAVPTAALRLAQEISDSAKLGQEISGAARLGQEIIKSSKVVADLARVNLGTVWARNMQRDMDAYRALGKSLQDTAIATAGLNFRGVTGPAGPAPMRLVASDPKTIEAVALPLETSLNFEVQASILKVMTDASAYAKITSERSKFGVERVLILIGVWIGAVTGLILVLRNGK